MEYCVYLLLDTRTHRTYIGSTNNFEHRLRQHNGEIKGGARYTSGGQWVPLVIVDGFANRTEALRFEWKAKRDASNRICRGADARAANIHRLFTPNLRYRYNSYGFKKEGGGELSTAPGEGEAQHAE